MPRFTSPILLVLALAACTADTPMAAPARVPNAVQSRSTAGLPIAGHCETTPLGPPVVTFPILRQEDTGGCEVTHLGRTVLHASRVVNLLTGAQVAEIIFTAAAGDVLRMRSVGTSTPAGPILRFTGTNTIVGGTGRFANAKGQLKATGVVDLATANASIDYAGVISFDASDHEH
ncbi:MAG: hypothetical protein ABI910_03255 [Gemmatimonadota bacterium]